MSNKQTLADRWAVLEKIAISFRFDKCVRVEWCDFTNALHVGLAVRVDEKAGKLQIKREPDFSNYANHDFTVDIKKILTLHLLMPI